MSTVLVAGTFDGIHPGHINFFEQALKHGDRLVVIVAREITVKKVKGQLPQIDEATRLRLISEQPLVSHSVLGSLKDPFHTVVKVNPDVVAIGYDQTSFTKSLKFELESRGISPEIIRLKPFHPEKYKSSKLK